MFQVSQLFPAALKSLFLPTLGSTLKPSKLLLVVISILQIHICFPPGSLIYHLPLRLSFLNYKHHCVNSYTVLWHRTNGAFNTLVDSQSGNGLVYEWTTINRKNVIWQPYKDSIVASWITDWTRYLDLFCIWVEVLIVCGLFPVVTLFLSWGPRSELAPLDPPKRCSCIEESLSYREYKCIPNRSSAIPHISNWWFHSFGYSRP